MRKNNIKILIAIFIIYLLIKFLVPFWNYIIYPITLIVTFLHEFWHAFFALITWGQIISIQVNPDWSWLAVTSWWIRSLVLMWWYIGSAIFGNILLYYAIKWKDKTVKNISIWLWAFIIFSSIFWFHNIVSSIVLIILWSALIYIANKIKYDKIFLSFIWLASLFYIIEDFNAWPSSDLAKFSEIFVVVPTFVWMYVWLFIVLAITWYNFYLMTKIKD